MHDEHYSIARSNTRRFWIASKQLTLDHIQTLGNCVWLRIKFSHCCSSIVTSYSRNPGVKRRRRGTDQESRSCHVLASPRGNSSRHLKTLGDITHSVLIDKEIFRASQRVSPTVIANVIRSPDKSGGMSALTFQKPQILKDHAPPLIAPRLPEFVHSACAYC